MSFTTNFSIRKQKNLNYSSEKELNINQNSYSNLSTRKTSAGENSIEKPKKEQLKKEDFFIYRTPFIKRAPYEPESPVKEKNSGMDVEKLGIKPKNLTLLFESDSFNSDLTLFE